MSIKDLIAKKKQKIEAKKQSFIRPSKPAPGKNVYRILPSWRERTEEEKNEGLPSPFFQEYGQHFIKHDLDQSKPDAVYICTDKTFDTPCEICEMIDKAIMSTGDDDYKKLLKANKSKALYLFNALHINGDKPNEPFLLEVGENLFLEICNIIDEYGDITSLKDGIDLIVTKSGTGFDTSYSVVPRSKEKSTPVDTTVMQNITNLETFVQQENASRQKVALEAIGKVTSVLPASTMNSLGAPSSMKDDEDTIIDDAEFEEVETTNGIDLDEDVDFDISDSPEEAESKVEDFDLDDLDDLLSDDDLAESA